MIRAVPQRPQGLAAVGSGGGLAGRGGRLLARPMVGGRQRAVAAGTRRPTAVAGWRQAAGGWSGYSLIGLRPSTRPASLTIRDAVIPVNPARANIAVHALIDSGWSLACTR